MTSIDARERTVRTYGGWRQARSIGLFGVGPVGTLTVLGCVVTPLLVASISLRLSVFALAPAGLITAVVLTRVGGMTVAESARRRMTWTWANLHGWTSYRQTTIDEHPRAWDLPGVLAPTQLVSAPDGRGGSFGLVWNRRTGHLTATLLCAATSTWLVDESDADGWVASWHSWLASLGYLTMVRSVAVTIETAPEAGARLRDVVLPRIATNAPEDTRRLMRELVARSPSAAADISTRVSVTFDPAASAAKPADIGAAADDVSRQLTGLESSLSACGVSVLRRCSAADVADLVRVAFDPMSRGELDRLRNLPGANTLDWAEAGPVAADEAWEHYRHDNAWSATWGWLEAPRQRVTSGVLTRLIAPARYGKRISLIYRPLPAGDAARMLEAQVNAAAFRDAYRRAQHRDATARDLADQTQAQTAAAEEAQGAGVVLMSLYVTATVTERAQLAEAAADVEARADQSKIRLRRLYGGQSAGFAATLPTGTTGGQR